MIFKSITEIVSPKEKKSFLEKIHLHIGIVKAVAAANGINFASSENDMADSTLARLAEMGIIGTAEHIKYLKTITGNYFDEFVASVNFAVRHSKMVGSNLDKLSNAIRTDYQRRQEAEPKPTVVDFFCGAGGLSCGFVSAGYKVALANDFEDVCIETYTYNHPEVSSERIIKGDIRNIVDHIEDYIHDNVDVVAGGPPCQGFSSANQQRIIDDPRNELYKYFLRAVEKIAPKFVVMENVRGMLPYAGQITEDYHSIRVPVGNRQLSYSVSCRILVSDDFGVAQKRQRLIFIAVRQDVLEQNSITPEVLFDNIQASAAGSDLHVLQDALDYIEPVQANRFKNTNEKDSDVSGSKVTVNSFEGNENTYLRLINGKRKIPVLYNHKARFVSDLNYDIYRLLDQGDDATDKKIEHLMPYSHRNSVFKDKYFKLVADKPSRTITAHMRMDCHSHIHPHQVRSLTPREAARVQSFPDDYVFLGAYLKTYMQIGNAVPPVMASYIAEEIRKYL